MRILVTGGSGFIGSHVVEEVLAAGHEVVIVDRAAGQAGTGAPAGVEVIAADLLDSGVCERAVRGIDAVSHQAARVGLGVDFADTPGYVRDNDAATARLLDALWASRFRGRFVLAGSMVVYGEGVSRCVHHGEVRALRRVRADLEAGQFDPRCPEPGCDERVTWATVGEDTPPDPRNVYAATKLHQEHLCSLWGVESGATVVALRYHNVYGPRMPADTPYAGVAAIFSSALRAGRAPQIYEDGSQTRDLVEVGDVARANLAALETPGVGPGAYNIASGQPRTVLDLAQALSDAIDPSLPPVVTGEWRAGDVRHIVADPQRAFVELGFRARTAFRDGINALVAASSSPSSPG